MEYARCSSCSRIQSVSQRTCLSFKKNKRSRVYTSQGTSPPKDRGRAGVPSPMTDGWTFHLRKEKILGQINLKPKIACEAIVKGKHTHTHTHTLERQEDQKAKKGANCGRFPASALTHQTRSKMSLKLPRNWDFNLRGEAGKIGTVNVFLLLLWFLHLSSHHLHVGLQGA